MFGVVPYLAGIHNGFHKSNLAHNEDRRWKALWKDSELHHLGYLGFHDPRTFGDPDLPTNSPAAVGAISSTPNRGGVMTTLGDRVVAEP